MLSHRLHPKPACLADGLIVNAFFSSKFSFPWESVTFSQHNKTLIDIIDPFYLGFSLTAIQVQDIIVEAVKIDP